ncbi:NAD(P)/FAD-dependent oxidoreductase [Virgibacillus halodenitrificans]|uniref:FAD-dependent oxidoreductase n=1 Tax=Virgibacillus halodenitrificans TaxID=1482 RepID=A0AAC9NLC6_VIRHA|nr:NAD(P)/FAD-dependent oxidoreductase [Virgibacillus halodenitrificans]APC48833.1 FAD-dependent oxidoreductase [Virgibacillus halodenitrificans]MBD1224318.1 NAD(P)/FAD-dependent oxidoreductase [Virgibacillus halodenitrificans]MCG1029407.1 NAD(P)/FAD-dependent oxidoreductase [Virgibacillus halodenitrificans]MCJ0931417.1 NAD(P)/FAD-dependent oxidoreductase [Virgibacillus halodenitrificans]MEC2158472.1 NAD(P)/FAD-dependent oxidoreductase [Virgibacillus halodenitrificans]
MSNKPKIVVLGAGYAGLTTTRRLVKTLSPEQAEIVLVNKHNYHYESTWLHEVAAGTINPNQARVMISDVVNPNRVRLVYDSVVEIKKDEQRVVLENSELSYDYLVVGLGFESNDFGIKGMAENAFAIEDIDSSREISEHIEYQFAKYNNDQNAEDHSLNILVGGAGFTGIELVGELANKVPELCKKYDIDRSKVRIINVEAAPSILPMFDKELVAYAKKSLEDRGVEIKIGAAISECTPEGFVVGDDKELIKAGTIIWTGGVKGSSVLGKSGFELTKGKVNVDGDLRMKGEENVFVIGDCSWVWNKEADRPYPPTAQLAMQEADVVAANLKALISNQPLTDFVFNDKGTVASLGHSDGIGNIFSGYKIQGKSAATMKKVVDNRSLLLLGGPKLVLKKGKFRPF